MAENLKGVNTFPYFHEVTCTHTEWTEIQLPNEARTISLGSESKAIYVAQNGAEDNAVIGSIAKGFAPVGNYIQIKLGIGMQRASVFVATKSSGGDVSIILEEQ
jgi:hypothetical protein